MRAPLARCRCQDGVDGHVDGAIFRVLLVTGFNRSVISVHPWSTVDQSTFSRFADERSAVVTLTVAVLSSLRQIARSDVTLSTKMDLSLVAISALAATVAATCAPAASMPAAVTEANRSISAAASVPFWEMSAAAMVPLLAISAAASVARPASLAVWRAPHMLNPAANIEAAAPTDATPSSVIAAPSLT